MTDDPTPSPITLEEFITVLRESFPIRVRQLQLDAALRHEPLSEYFYERDGVLFGRFWLMVYDKDDQIQDIKEQEIGCIFDKTRNPVERVRAMLEGFHEALKLRAKTEPKNEWYEYAMPYEFFEWGVLKLVKPQTASDFEDVFARRWKIGPYFGLRSKPKPPPKAKR